MRGDEMDNKYVCPVCHNTEHPPGAKFCMVCGEAFPLHMSEDQRKAVEKRDQDWKAHLRERFERCE